MRLAGGWAIALAAVLVLSLVLAPPTSAPGAVVAGGDASSTPLPTPGSSYADGDLPEIPHWPPQAGGGAAAADARRQPLPAETVDALSAALDRARRAYGLSVLGLGVRIGDGSFTAVSGLARDGITPLGGDSPFGIASITKTFTASIVLQLVEEGSLSLDDEVAPLLPDVSIPAGVTVEQLLSHTSGIADLLTPMRAPMKADPARIWTAPEVLARLGPPRFAPGTDYAYSNSNYVVLGLLVERITGQAFADELSRRLLEPLGLDATGVLTAAGAPPLMTPSWASAFGTSGFMYSSVGDMLDWSDALYGGHVLRRASLARMLSFGEDGYGLGAQRIELGGLTGYGHSGLLQSFTSLLVRMPDEDVTIALVGSWQGFEPSALLTRRVDGQPAILDLALGAAGVPLPTATPVS
jgi:D-alanyl-D-alanine carboxypeptidase